MTASSAVDVLSWALFRLSLSIPFRWQASYLEQLSMSAQWWRSADGRWWVGWLRVCAANKTIENFCRKHVSADADKDDGESWKKEQPVGRKRWIRGRGKAFVGLAAPTPLHCRRFSRDQPAHQPPVAEKSAERRTLFKGHAQALIGPWEATPKKNGITPVVHMNASETL